MDPIGHGQGASAGEEPASFEGALSVPSICFPPLEVPQPTLSRSAQAHVAPDYPAAAHFLSRF